MRDSGGIAAPRCDLDEVGDADPARTEVPQQAPHRAPFCGGHIDAGDFLGLGFTCPRRRHRLGIRGSAIIPQFVQPQLAHYFQRERRRAQRLDGSIDQIVVGGGHEAPVVDLDGFLFARLQQQGAGG